MSDHGSNRARNLGRAKARLAKTGVWKFLNRRTGQINAVDADHLHAAEHRAVIIGYGPIGQTVARLMKDHGIHPVIAEMNLDTARRLREKGLHAIYGDATRPEVLEAVDIRAAAALLIAGPAPEQAAEIARLGRLMNPPVQVLARAHYLKDSAVILSTCANEDLTGEGEVALAMTEYIMEQIGSTPEQIDRERQRVRDEVFRAASPSGHHRNSLFKI